MAIARRYALIAIVVLGMVVIWYVVISLRLVSVATFPYPHEVIESFPRLFSLPERGRVGSVLDTVSTAVLALGAFGLSIPLGLVVGILIMRAGSMSSALLAVLDFVRSIPVTALAPAFLVMFGVGASGRFALACFGSTVVICLATCMGLSSWNNTRRSITIVHNWPVSRRLVLVDLPEAMPAVWVGMRTGASLALVLVVVSELLVGGGTGLGRVIAHNQYGDDKGMMYAAILMTGCIGFTLNRLLMWLGRPWTVVESK